MCIGVSRTGGHGMITCVGLVEMGSLCHPQASKGIKMAPRGVKRCHATKEPIASDSDIEEVGATAAAAAAAHEPQDLPEDELSDGDTKFGVVETDKTEAGAITPVYEDPTRQDDTTVHRV